MMNIDKKKQVSLYSPYFDTMRTDLDAYIRRALLIMENKDISTGSITLKIDFNTQKETVKCDNSPTGQREAVAPNIGYKLSFNIKAKAEHKGDVVGKGNEVIQGDDGNYYIVSKDEASGQLNMFNGYDELPNAVEAESCDTADDDELPSMEEALPTEAFEEDE